MRLPRYEVRSITGYSSVTPGQGALTSSYWVADTWNCYREVPLLRRPGRDPIRHPSVPTAELWTTRKSLAEWNCDRLNAQHGAEAR